MKRRNFILSGLGLAGALVVGWGVMPPRSRLGKPDNMLSTEGDVALNGWIKIAKTEASCWPCTAATWVRVFTMH